MVDNTIDKSTIEAYYDYFTSPPLWMYHAACVNHSGILHPINDAEYIASTVCPTCPVKSQCREIGQLSQAHEGVFGGEIIGISRRAKHGSK